MKKLITIIIVLIGALAALAAPWIMRRRGAGGDWVQGNLVVTGVGPRPDATASSPRSEVSVAPACGTFSEGEGGSPAAAARGRREGNQATCELVTAA